MGSCIFWIAGFPFGDRLSEGGQRSEHWSLLEKGAASVLLCHGVFAVSESPAGRSQLWSFSVLEGHGVLLHFGAGFLSMVFSHLKATDVKALEPKLHRQPLPSFRCHGGLHVSESLARTYVVEHVLRVHGTLAGLELRDFLSDFRRQRSGPLETCSCD